MQIGKLLSTIVGAALLWLFVVGIAAFALWPSLPSSWSGWIALVILGPPLYLAGEFVADRVWPTKVGRRLSEHPSRTFRIVAGVVIGFILLLAIGVVMHLISAK
jgi:hypothetical protein